MPTGPATRRLLFSYLAFVVSGIALAALTGRLEPVRVNDSASYQEYSFASFDSMARSIRTPGYPAWLKLITGSFGIAAVPVCQVILHATASWWLWIELRRWEMSFGAALAAALAVGVGCTPTDHVSTISSDALGASVGVMTATATLRAIRLGGSVVNCLSPALLAATAISIRPAYLFLLVWLPGAVILLMIRRGYQVIRFVRTAMVTLLLVALPVAGWMAARYISVGEFGIAPFGHQNLAGILVQLVSEDELRQLGELGGAIADRKESYLAGLGDPVDLDPTATMTIDARWDAMTYFVVIPAAVEVVGNDSITAHRAIARLNRLIILRWPDRYLVWIAKAIRRGAWAIAADIAMHPVFLATIGLWMMLIVCRAATGSLGISPGRPPLGFDALAIIAITYLIAKLGFVALSSPPIGRFSDAAAIFLPALGGAVLADTISRPRK